jgi:hypothetical protein
LVTFLQPKKKREREKIRDTRKRGLCNSEAFVDKKKKRERERKERGGLVSEKDSNFYRKKKRIIKIRFLLRNKHSQPRIQI